MRTLASILLIYIESFPTNLRWTWNLADSLEAQRIQVAQDVFNTPEGLDDEEDIVDETIEDEDETLELGGEGEDGLDADIEAEDEISDEEIEDAIEQVFDEDEEILAELDDDED